MTRIEFHDSVKSATLKMVDGNPGAISVCTQLLANEIVDPDSALKSIGSLLLLLDSFGIYGSRIWMLYKDVCDEDIVKTIAVLRARQMGFLQQPELDCAIDNQGKGIDVDDLVKKVQAVLPNFGKEREC